MLAKNRICLQHFWFFGQHCNEWPMMKDNPGSGRTWNLIMYLEGLPPLGQEILAASMFSGVSSGQ